MDDRSVLRLAVAEARAGLAEGGVPIGSVLVIDGEVGGSRPRSAGSGQERHPSCRDELSGRVGETARSRVPQSHSLLNAFPVRQLQWSRPPLWDPAGDRGENRTFRGPEDYLRARSVTVDVVDDAECFALMKELIETQPESWNEDIGV